MAAFYVSTTVCFAPFLVLHMAHWIPPYCMLYYLTAKWHKDTPCINIHFMPSCTLIIVKASPRYFFHDLICHISVVCNWRFAKFPHSSVICTQTVNWQKRFSFWLLDLDVLVSYLWNMTFISSLLHIKDARSDRAYVITKIAQQIL